MNSAPPIPRTPADAESAAELAALAELHRLTTQHPGMEIWMGVNSAGARLWFARGKDGSPWLLMSADLDRFRGWLAAA